MNKETFYVKGAQNQQLFVRRFSGENSNNKVIQILHGMAEHSERYIDFAEYLVGCGYIVYAQDHRKHGYSIKGSQKVGYYTEDTWQDMVEDVKCVQEDILSRESVDKVILIGHSMGSFLTRHYLMDYGQNVEKAVLIGTGYLGQTKAKSGIALAKAVKRFTGHKPSPLLDKLLLNGYNKAFEPCDTSIDWICSDKKVIDKYMDDPLCGFAYTPGYYVDVLTGLAYINRQENIAKTEHIPLLFISGQEDPVGEMTLGVTKVHDIYARLGYNTELVIIEDARHEILNETNKQLTYESILDFINNNK